MEFCTQTTSNEHNQKTLLIVPCYNEENNILELYRELQETNFYILVVNDASRDHSLAILRENNIPHLDLPINLGIGGAVQAGYRYALRNGYDIAVQVDGDGQHDPAWIERLLEPLVRREADMAIGSRFIAGEGFQSSTIRRAGIAVFKVLLLICGGKHITDATSGFRAINRRGMELFNSYYANDYPEPESVMHALRNKLRVAEVPVAMRERQGGVSSISLWKSVYYMFKVSIAILFSAIATPSEHCLRR